MFLLLRLFAIGCILAGLSHVALGLGADAALGANPGEAMLEASLDSQNRFYGMTFTVYGALTWLFTTDTARYGTMFRTLMVIFFLGGLARLLSIAIHGMPSPMVCGLAVSELLLPPIFLFWQARFSPPKP